MLAGILLIWVQKSTTPPRVCFQSGLGDSTLCRYNPRWIEHTSGTYPKSLQHPKWTASFHKPSLSGQVYALGFCLIFLRCYTHVFPNTYILLLFVTVWFNYKDQQVQLDLQHWCSVHDQFLSCWNQGQGPRLTYLRPVLLTFRAWHCDVWVWFKMVDLKLDDYPLVNRDMDLFVASHLENELFKWWLFHIYIK